MPKLRYQRDKHPWSQDFHSEQIDQEICKELLEHLTPEEKLWLKDCSAKLTNSYGEKVGFGIMSAMEFWMKVLNHWAIQDMDVEARKLEVSRG